jgi:hypothetical protein
MSELSGSWARKLHKTVDIPLSSLRPEISILADVRSKSLLYGVREEVMPLEMSILDNEKPEKGNFQGNIDREFVKY